MPVVSSQYWNSVHGFTVDDVHKDEEGLQTMRVLVFKKKKYILEITFGKVYTSFIGELYPVKTLLFR